MNEPNPSDRDGGMMRRVLMAVAIAAAAFIILMFFWYAAQIVLLVFGGVLLAIFLRALSDPLARRTRLSEGWALGLVVLLLVIVIGGGLAALGPSIANQVDKLTQQVPESWDQLKQQIGQYGWGEWLLGQAGGSGEAMPDGGQMVRQATGYAATALWAITAFVFILFIGLFVAADPPLYRTGLMHLVPRNQRPRAAEVLDTLGSVLQWWLLGKAVSMALVGVLTTVGLWIIGVPLALVLGILAMLLAFIPNIGPILAAIPALLIAFVESPATALIVLALYIGVQTVESYLITPLIQQRTIALPPALTVTAQALMGLFMGVLGLLFATPLVAAVLVLAKMLYVENALGDHAVDPKK